MLAADKSMPLLERAKFLAIFASISTGSTWSGGKPQRREQMGLSVRSADGLTPREQLGRIGEQTQQLAGMPGVPRFGATALGEEGIHIVTWAGGSAER